MPAPGRNSPSTKFHFLRRVDSALWEPFFSGRDFILGVSLANFLATSGSRENKYRAWALDLNGIVMGV